MRILVSTVLAVAVLAACSGKTASSASPSPLPSAASVVPLYDGSTVVEARDYKTNTAKFKGCLECVDSPDDGPVDERIVIARSDASADDLETWVDTLRANPPAGFTVHVDKDQEALRQRALINGVDFVLLKGPSDALHRSVLVATLDPVAIQEHFGPAVGLIDNYRSLPLLLRSAADSRMKQQFGITGADLTDPSTEIGAAISAYDAVKNSNQRAIVEIDVRP